MEHFPQVRLTGKGRRWRLSGHPWIYRDDVAEAPALAAGDLVAVLDHRGAFLGQAFYSAASRIALRMVTYGDEAVDGPSGRPGSLTPWLTAGGWWRTPTPSA